MKSCNKESRHNVVSEPAYPKEPKVNLVHHLRGEEVELRAVEPLAALITALQSLVPWGEYRMVHHPQTHSLMREEGPRFARFEDKHCGGETKEYSVYLLIAEQPHS